MNAPSLYEFRQKTPELEFVNWDEPIEVAERPLTDDEADQFRARLVERYGVAP